jgi:hypothetical protein
MQTKEVGKSGLTNFQKIITNQKALEKFEGFNNITMC